MTRALRQRVVVQPGGVVSVQSPELSPGRTAEVIILIEAEDAGEAASPTASGQRMAAALERLASGGGLAAIDDPSAWQRDTRRDRDLPGRDE